jgi:hypothetical protein
MTRTFIVPVKTSKAGTLALRTGRLSSGERIGLAFTSEASFLLAMGPSQRWVKLGEQALRAMLAPLGVDHFRVDPHPIGELGRHDMTWHAQEMYVAQSAGTVKANSQ